MQVQNIRRLSRALDTENSMVGAEQGIDFVLEEYTRTLVERRDDCVLWQCRTEGDQFFLWGFWQEESGWLFKVLERVGICHEPESRSGVRSSAGL